MSSTRFRRSADGVSSLALHVVWCPKSRRRLLVGRVAARLNELLDEIAFDNAWEIVANEVMPDHVHIFRLRPIDSPAELARRFKEWTSRALTTGFAWLGRKKVLWSKSYFATSAGYVSERTVGQYIEHQWGTPV